MKHVTRPREFARAWKKVKSSGISFADSLSSQGHKRIALYCDDYLYRTVCKKLFAALGNSDAKIVGLITPPLASQRFRGIRQINITEIAGLEIDLVVVVPYWKFYFISHKLKQYTDAKIVPLTKLIGEAAPEDQYKDISDYLRGKGVTMHLFTRQAAGLIQNPSLLETVHNGTPPPELSTRYPTYNLLYNNNPPLTENDFIACLTTVCKVISHNPKTESRLADVKSEHVNIINGNRYVPDAPDKYDNTVYMFGDCVVAGALTQDNNTLANQLQKILNEAWNNYRVVSCTYTMRDFRFLIKKIHDLSLSKGDVIIYINNPAINHDHTKCYFDSLPCIIDHGLMKSLNRPHDRGEVFIDYVHVIDKAFSLMAQELFNKIFIDSKLSPDNEADANSPNLLISKQSKQNKIPKALKEYVKYLDKVKVSFDGTIGAIVVNCNPFTKGHQFVIEYAAKESDFLYIFVVEEDRSVFPFKDRIELVRKGTSHLDNVMVIPSGAFIISTTTFPGYFNKEDSPTAVIDATYDLEIFAQHIAPALGISVRFAGQEPNCNITRQYNRDMQNILPKYGIEFHEIPRLENAGEAISASRVRQLLNEGRFDEIRELVPESTYKYLIDNKM